MKEIDLAHLRKLAEAATPGPWFAHWNEHYWQTNTECELFPGQQIGDVCASKFMYVKGEKEVIEDHGEANAAYIAAANPQTILSLLSMIEELTQNLAQCKQDYFNAHI